MIDDRVVVADPRVGRIGHDGVTEVLRAAEAADVALPSIVRPPTVTPERR